MGYRVFDHTFFFSMSTPIIHIHTHKKYLFVYCCPSQLWPWEIYFVSIVKKKKKKKKYYKPSTSMQFLISIFFLYIFFKNGSHIFSSRNRSLHKILLQMSDRRYVC